MKFKDINEAKLFVRLDDKVIGNELFVAQRQLSEFYKSQKKGFDVNMKAWDAILVLITKVEKAMTSQKVKT